MADAYVLFADGIGVGILARQRRGYLFHAAISAVAALDGAFFLSGREARRTVRRQAAGHRSAGGSIHA